MINPILAELTEHLCPESATPVELEFRNTKFKFLPVVTQAIATWRDSKIPLDYQGSSAMISGEAAAVLASSCVTLNGQSLTEIFAKDLEDPVKTIQDGLKSRQDLNDTDKEEVLKSFVRDQTLELFYKYLLGISSDTVAELHFRYIQEIRGPWVEKHKDFFGSSTEKSVESGPKKTPES